MSDVRIDNQPNIEGYVCPEHGDFNARIQVALNEIGELIQAGFTEDEIEYWVNDKKDEYIDRAYLAHQAIAKVLLNPMAEISLFNALRSNKTTKISELSRKLADEFMNKLGYEPTPQVVVFATMNLALQVALTNHRMLRGGSSGVHESALVNGFTSHLVARVDRSRLCISDNSDEENDNIRSAVSNFRQLAQTLPGAADIAEEFLGMKIKVAHNSLRTLKDLMRLEDELSMRGSSEEISREGLVARNDALTNYVQRIRSYGVKDVSFPSGDIVYDNSEIVLINPYTTDLGSVKSELTRTDPLALVKIVPNDADAQTKYKLTKQDNPLGTTSEWFETNAYHIITVGRDGHLHAGITSTSLSIQDVFEHDGRPEMYEKLRSALLSFIFMSIAPATIVDKMRDIAPIKQNTAQGAATNKGDVIYPIILPRKIIRFFEGRRIGEVKSEFKDALHTEQQTEEKAHRNLRRHAVVGHVMRIPKGAHPSPAAYANALKYEGPDYVIPEGYTYVKPHERGDERFGRVLGHTARVATQAN